MTVSKSTDIKHAVSEERHTKQLCALFSTSYEKRLEEQTLLLSSQHHD